jgi:hypothetical protein
MNKWLSKRDRLIAYGLSVTIIAISQIVSGSTLPAQISQWASPSTIPGINLDSIPPILIADENRTVHAFVSQWVGSVDPISAVVYTRWTLEQGWSVPIDVLISPVNEARVTSAYLDKKGVMHLVFFGGNGMSGDIYYSKAPANTAGDARSWSVPVLVGEDAGDPESAVLVGNEQGISIIYHGRRDGHGVYVVTSKDDGDTWSNPTLIFLSDSDSPTVWRLHAVESESGWLHAIWNVYNDAGQGRGIYYARSKSGDAQWSDPVLLAAAQDGLGTQTPTIIEHDGVLFAVFIFPPKITMRRSMDNGATWGDPVILFPRHVGVNGSLSLVIDGNDNLHLLFGQRISGNPDIHGMWHSIWLGNRWIEPDAVVKGPRVVDQEGLNGFDPYDARAVVSQGNVILVLWQTDPGAGDNGIWFSYAVVNAPELPVATLQSGEVITAIDSPIPLATPTLPGVDNQQIVIDKERQGQSPFVWMGLAVLIIGILRFIYMLFERNV